MSAPNQHRSYHLGSIVAAGLCIAAAFLLYTHRQYVVDQLSVWQYQPSSEIQALADRTSMTSNGQFYFYASQPALEDAQNFNKNCDRKENTAAILGCYNGRNIHIYNVTDTRLDGIREVTAAHEMLHVAYERLSEGDKKTVNALLEAEYKKLQNDKDFSQRMAFYARTEPGQRDNELHSVIGTEVGNISPELEAHYKQYFDDRQKVVQLHANYSNLFEQLQAQGDNLNAQLTQLGATIEEDTIAYNKQVNVLNQDIEQFNARAQAEGGFGSQEAFQTARQALVERASQLNSQRDAINQSISRYETLRQELIATANQTEALNQSINSSLAPAPSL